MFGGFNTGKRPYIVLSGDTTMDAFNLFHEHAHNIPQLLNAISSMLRDGWISKREYNAYKNSRKRRRAANLGIPVSEVSEESEQTIRTEFACDMLGVYAMQAFCNEDHWSAYGIDAETIGSIKQTLDEALAAGAITETDAETAEREFSTLEEAGRAISETEAKGETDYDRGEPFMFSENAPKPFSNVTAQQLETMSDEERAQELKNSVIVAPVFDESILTEKNAVENIETAKSVDRLTSAKPLLKTLATKFDAFKTYRNENVEVEFELSGHGIKESAQKQLYRTGSVYDQARLLSVLGDVIAGAVPLETHPDLKGDALKRVYVLLSAFSDGSSVIPVQLEVKEYKQASEGAKLYILVTMGKQKTGVVKTQPNLIGSVHASHPVFNINVADIVKDVNLSDGDFLMYLPDQMLNSEQERTKWAAIDKRYFKALKAGNDYEAAQRAKLAARNAGYTIKAWHGSRHLFNAFSKDKRGGNTNTKASHSWFFAGDEDTASSYYPYGVMKALAKKDPRIWKDSDAENLKQKGKLYDLYLKMENPLVVDVAGYDYAAHKENSDALMEYVEQADRDGNDGIILLHVRDNQLNPSAEESTVYMFRDSNQAKLADPVTYDDDGNVIPLSERFNAEKDDIRFSENAPTKKQERLKKVWELFDDGATPQDYYAESGSDFDLKTNNLLRGLMLRNGENVGGTLADDQMERVLDIFGKAKKRFAVGMTLSSPVRIFEDVTGWGGSTAEERANNIKDGNFLKNTYYEYGNVQAANREAWIAEKMR